MVSEQIKEAAARTRMWTEADRLWGVLQALNEYGDYVDTRIATQADGLPYGEVHDGLKALLRLLVPGEGDAVLDIAYDTGEKPSAALSMLRQTRKEPE